MPILYFIFYCRIYIRCAIKGATSFSSQENLFSHHKIGASLFSFGWSTWELVLLPHLSSLSDGRPLLVAHQGTGRTPRMACPHGHVSSQPTQCWISVPGVAIERRRFRRQGRNADRSRRYVDDVMRQVRAKTTNGRDNAYGAGIPHQLPEREPCSNGHDACND